MTKTRMPGSFYRPATGGHAPGDLRDAFLLALESWRTDHDWKGDPVVNFRSQQTRLSTLCGLMWKCVDTMPGWDFEEVAGAGTSSPQSRSYAAMARWVRPQLRER
jgi:hypothetical protein